MSDESFVRSQTAPLHPRLMEAAPAKPESDPVAEVGAVAAASTRKRSEARRDAILAVASAVKRRGDNPVTDWNGRDADTVWVIADLLATLEGK